MIRFGLLILCVAFVAGCASHEGGLSNSPVSGGPDLAPDPKKDPGPVTFHYAPDKPDYEYAVITMETPTGGATRKAEMDFNVKVAAKGKQFTNDTSITAMSNGDTPQPVDRYKGFHVQTTVDAHGRVVSSTATQEAKPFLGTASDLGSSFTLPSKPVKIGDKWTEDKQGDDGPYTVTYTFISLETVGKQRVATFEKQAVDEKGARTPRPTLIKVDADTGVMVDKLAEFVVRNENSPGRELTTQLEIKLK